MCPIFPLHSTSHEQKQKFKIPRQQNHIFFQYTEDNIQRNLVKAMATNNQRKPITLSSQESKCQHRSIQEENATGRIIQNTRDCNETTKKGEKGTGCRGV